MKQIIECVPNFSEGRDMDLIRKITYEIESVTGVKLLGVDPGITVHRTVVTFAGAPGNVAEAAFRAVRKATQLIDMRRHKGVHPRLGATDVCPLVPVSNVTMEECVEYARRLSGRIGTELGIPVYCYGSAALKTQRNDLAEIRTGGYEGLREKLERPEWKPDFGPVKFLPKTGAVAVGARDYLVAFNVNLVSASVRQASAITREVRDKRGIPVTVPGTLKAVKAMGWYIREYGAAQVSMNITDLSVTPVHVAFEEVRNIANARGIKVSGSELVGLIPVKALLDAGRYFLRKQKRSPEVPDGELIRIAIGSLGLDDLYPFDPGKKIIEYLITDDQE